MNKISSQWILLLAVVAALARAASVVWLFGTPEFRVYCDREFDKGVASARADEPDGFGFGLAFSIAMFHPCTAFLWIVAGFTFWLAARRCRSAARPCFLCWNRWLPYGMVVLLAWWVWLDLRESLRENFRALVVADVATFALLGLAAALLTFATPFRDAEAA